MRKVIVIVLLILIPISLTLGFLGKSLRETDYKSVEFFLNNREISIEIDVLGYIKDTYCVYDDNKVFLKNGKCKLGIPNEEITVYVKNKYNSIPIKVNPDINAIIDFTVDEEKTYLHINERKEVIVSTEVIGSPTHELVLESEDESIAKVEGNTIIGVGNGKTNIIARMGYTTKTIEVIVTNLITMPVWMGQNKSLLPCNRYTEEEAALLDEFLDYEIQKVGDHTRMAAVVAARFLTLELPYRIPYFYENGRVSDTGVHFVDGEGRYYKKGLYLAESKKESIIATWKGPAIWGCPLMNLEDDLLNGYTAYTYKPNGLDCSGFISWAIRNGGFDPGDNGAGENPENPYQMTDLGYYTRLTRELVYSGQIKVGDLFNFWGHIAMLIGIKDNKYYIAESLMGPRFDGATVKEYTFDNVTDTFGYVVLMDSFYKEDGKYSEYWE